MKAHARLFFAMTLLSSVLSNQAFADAFQCQQDLAKVCGNCGYEEICNKLDMEKASWTDDMRACVINSINAMAGSYFQIQQNIENPPPPPPSNSRHRSRSAFQSSKNDANNGNNNKHNDNDNNGGWGFSSDDDNFGNNGNSNQPANQPAWRAGQYYNPPPPPRVFANKIVADCKKDAGLGDYSNKAVFIAGEANFHSSLGYPDDTHQAVGGLSGIAINHDKKELYMISDSQMNATMATLGWTFNPQGDTRHAFRFVVKGHATLESNFDKHVQTYTAISVEKGKTVSQTKTEEYETRINLDREDVVLLPNGNFLVSSEPDGDSNSIKTPSLMTPTLLQEFSPNGRLVKGIVAPPDYNPEWKTEKTNQKCWQPDPTPMPVQKTPTTPTPSTTNTGSNMAYFSGSNSSDNWATTSVHLSPPGQSEDGTVKWQEAKGTWVDCGYSTTKQVKGLEFNKGIEGMTIVPGTDTILFSNEQPLLQDHPGLFGRNYIRIYSARFSDMERGPADRYYKYPITLENENGVSALLAINERTLLVLERGFDSFAQEAVVRIYKVDLSRAGRDGKLSKTLVVDFNKDLRKQFAAGFRKVDNFEGMALGPQVKAGYRTVFMVSDNNFSRNQRTVVLALEISEGALK